MKRDTFAIVAKAIRMEFDKNNKMYLVFEVTDSDFKNHIKDNWSDDIPIRIIGKNLVK
jgi:hypothetical protein